MNSLKLCVVSFLTICLIASCSKTSSIEIFISTKGSDKNPGTLEKPFATLEKARDHATDLKNQYPNKDIIVQLRGGTYTLTKTFVLKPEHSAAEGQQIVYRNYADEKPVLSSGVRLRNWSKVTAELEGLPEVASGKIWETNLPDHMQGFLTMYESNSRLPRARSKGFVPDTDIHPRDNPDPNMDRHTLYYPKGMIRNWSNISDPELFIIPSYPWWMNVLSFESVDEKKRIARTTLPGTDYLCDMVSYCRGGKGYEATAWIENTIDVLDEPGEWVVNTKTRKIYLWPTSTEPSDSIYIPKLRELILVEGINDEQGDNDVPVKGIVFEGLIFTKADRGVMEAGDQGIQHDWEMLDKDNAMLRFRGAENCFVNRCRFFNAGGNGIRMDLYAQNIRVENCLFEHLGQSAVMMLGYGLGKKDVNKGHRIYNNHIHHCGEIYWQSQMITAWQSGENYIGHNYLHHIPRKAICISGVRFHWLASRNENPRECVNSIRWNEIGTPKNFKEMAPFLHSRNNVIEYNEIHDALEKLGDGSGINLSGSGNGNIVRNNYVHDISALNPSAGIRTDNDQNTALIENNIICNISSAGISPKGENTIRNNYIINACVRKNYGVLRGIGQHKGGLTNLDHNIVYNTSRTVEFYYFYRYQDYTSEEIAAKTIDHNLYFSPYIEESKWKSLQFIKSLGYDKNSSFADPLFEDWQNGNFTLKPGSPALKMGISQIDISQVGLTDDFPWE